MTDWFVWSLTGLVIVTMFYHAPVPVALAFAPVIICAVAIALSRRAPR